MNHFKHDIYTNIYLGNFVLKWSRIVKSAAFSTFLNRVNVNIVILNAEIRLSRCNFFSLTDTNLFVFVDMILYSMMWDIF